MFLDEFSRCRINYTNKPVEKQYFLLLLHRIEQLFPSYSYTPFFAQNQFCWPLFHQIFSMLCSSKSFHRPIFYYVCVCVCACVDLYRFNCSKNVYMNLSVIYTRTYNFFGYLLLDLL